MQSFSRTSTNTISDSLWTGNKTTKFIDSLLHLSSNFQQTEFGVVRNSAAGSDTDESDDGALGLFTYPIKSVKHLLR